MPRCVLRLTRVHLGAGVTPAGSLFMGNLRAAHCSDPGFVSLYEFISVGMCVSKGTGIHWEVA